MIEEIKYQINELVIAVIRTIVPTIVGVLTAYLITKGINLGDEIVLALQGLLTTVFSAAYYVLARILELKFKQFSLLIINRKVKYVRSK